MSTLEPNTSETYMNTHKLYQAAATMTIIPDTVVEPIVGACYSSLTLQLRSQRAGGKDLEVFLYSTQLSIQRNDMWNKHCYCIIARTLLPLLNSPNLTNNRFGSGQVPQLALWS